LSKSTPDVYMSSDGPQKWDNRFRRHCTVRFTWVEAIHVWLETVTSETWLKFRDETETLS